MTKIEIMKLAELPEPEIYHEAAWDYTNQGSPELFKREDWSMILSTGHIGGQKYENSRLLPLIETLAESNEKLVEALREIRGSLRCEFCLANNDIVVKALAAK